MAAACVAGAGLAEFEELDITPHGSACDRSFGSDELVLLGVPVYGGRIPGPAKEKFRRLQAQETPAILFATYGNRHYDDALREFADLASDRGFRPVGAAACVAQHTLDPECAAGRPTKEDLAGARNFAAKVAALLAGTTETASRLIVPGKSPYKDYMPKALPQSVSVSCIMCGQCWINCPTGAIVTEEPARVDSASCIACMGCITICPVKARVPAAEFLQKVAERLAPLCSTPKTNEYFQI